MAVKDAKQISNAQDCLHYLEGSFWFSTLYFASGYLQIGMNPR
jgi:hypothetical protein